MSQALRVAVMLTATSLVMSACVSDSSPSSGSTSTRPGVVTTTQPTTGSESPSTGATTSTSPTTVETIEPVSYAAVAWEAENRLGIIARLPQDQQVACSGDQEEGLGCGPLGLITTQSVPPGPHNVAAFGSVVLVTHPGEGLVSRYDVETEELGWAAVGVEPHDVDFAPDGKTAYITDESGRRLITVNPDTLEWQSAIDLPAEPHDAAVEGDTIWVTMIGRSDLARVNAGAVELVEVGGSPHDLEIDPQGRIWLTHWNSSRLTVFDPKTGRVDDAPAGVAEPHHFATAPDGSVWISDNGADSIVQMLDGELARTVTVGPTPHHLGFLDPYLVVAVSGTGRVAIVDDAGSLVGEVPLGRGLHGVAVGETEQIRVTSGLGVEASGTDDWALAPCAVATALGNRVLCPNPKPDGGSELVDDLYLNSGRGFAPLGQSSYSVSYYAPEVAGNINHPDVIVEGRTGSWSDSDLNEWFPGENVDTVSVGDRRLTIREVIEHSEFGGFHGGHTVALWEEGGWAYVVSIHRDSSEVPDQVVAHAAALVPWPVSLDGADLGEVADCRARLPDGLGPQFAISEVMSDGTIDIAAGGLSIGGEPVSVRLIWEPARKRTRIPEGTDLSRALPNEHLLADVTGPSFCRRIRLPSTEPGTYLVGVEMDGILPIQGLVVTLSS